MPILYKNAPEEPGNFGNRGITKTLLNTQQGFLIYTRYPGKFTFWRSAAAAAPPFVQADRQ